MELLFAALVGLVLGSFANVLIARVPVGEGWARGSSRCPQCHHDLAWYDNIPLVSWVLLGRRCRHCHRPISGRYPLVELMVALLVVAVVVAFGLTLVAAALVYMAFISVALAWIDVDVKRLPDAIVLPAYPVVAAILAADAAVTGQWSSLGRAGTGLLVMGGFYGVMWLVYPAGMGFGDVKLAGVLGGVAGYLGWQHLAVAAIAGPMVGGVVVLVGLATRRLTRRSVVPYGPALLVGAWLGFLVGAPIATGFVALAT